MNASLARVQEVRVQVEQDVERSAAAGSSDHCEMAATYTQVTTGARLAYTFSVGVEPNAQGL